MSSRAWLKRRKKDFYYRRAKEEGYRSRAAYKLLEAVKKHRFMKMGDIVVDLGAAPGGWLQASSEVVGRSGYVLGVDIKPIEPLPLSNVKTILGDITSLETLKKIEEALPRKADVVLSDVSPSVSGVWEVDHARQMDLAQHSLRIATSILRPAGNFFVKVFEGDLLKGFVDQLKECFVKVIILKPKASRARSSELYVLGLSFKGVKATLSI